MGETIDEYLLENIIDKSLRASDAYEKFYPYHTVHVPDLGNPLNHHIANSAIFTETISAQREYAYTLGELKAAIDMCCSFTSYLIGGQGFINPDILFSRLHQEISAAQNIVRSQSERKQLFDTLINKHVRGIK